jgi:hypothetical protein
MHGMKDIIKLVHIIRQTPSKALAKKRKASAQLNMVIPQVPNHSYSSIEWRKDNMFGI